MVCVIIIAKITLSLNNNIMKKLLLMGLLLTTSGYSVANDFGRLMSSCIYASSQKYQIHPHVLWAIAAQESRFHAGAIGKNSNGTLDIGVMQINSSWLPKLQRMNISKIDLFDPCTNIDVGAWILAHNISQYGYNWTAIGAYNARSPHKRQRYALKIWQQLKQVSAL